LRNEVPVFVSLSPTNPDPLYQQVTDQIMNAIACGDLAASDRLPSIRELAKVLDISVITIKRAYADLEAAGYIVSRAGLGSFVAEVDREELRAAKLRELKTELTGILRASARFGISVRDIIELIGRIEED
jgi:GntR family transcriptional regulator